MRLKNVCNFYLTDSILYRVSFDKRTHTEGAFWQRLATLAPFLDVRDYKNDHPYFAYNSHIYPQLKSWQEHNAFQIGLLRDEAGSDCLVSEFVALKAKVG